MKQTKNGMLREDKSAKLNYLSYLDPDVLERYASHMKKGEEKHGRSNWKKGGYPLDEYLESMFRHLNSLVRGDKDEDHASSLMFNVVGYMYEQLHGKFRAGYATMADMTEAQALEQLSKLLDGQTLTFSFEEFASGEWIARCNEIPGIITGGSGDYTERDMLIRDAIISAAGIKGDYGYLLKNMGTKQPGLISGLLGTKKEESEYVL